MVKGSLLLVMGMVCSWDGMWLAKEWVHKGTQYCAGQWLDTSGTCCLWGGDGDVLPWRGRVRPVPGEALLAQSAEREGGQQSCRAAAPGGGVSCHLSC